MEKEKCGSLRSVGTPGRGPTVRLGRVYRNGDKNREGRKESQTLRNIIMEVLGCGKRVERKKLTSQHLRERDKKKLQDGKRSRCDVNFQGLVRETSQRGVDYQISNSECYRIACEMGDVG